MRSEKVDISISSDYYNSTKDANLALEKPFKEFIDNSTQSFFDNIERLSGASCHALEIRINFNQSNIIIEDNAFGMNKKTFDRSLRLGGKSDYYAENSRGQYGVGLKNASLYLGNHVLIESTEYGNDELYSAVLDSKQLQQNIKYLDRNIDDINPNAHFTRITISELRQKYTQQNIVDLGKKLGKIYNRDLSSNLVSIVINDKFPVTYTLPNIWIDEDTGSELLAYFDGEVNFESNIYRYHGWLAILEIASTSDAGFSLLKSNRQIVPGYRPEKVFGKTNDFAYQRVIGEINLDDWPVVSNKTDFKWADGLEEKFIESLVENEKVSKIIKQARALRKRDKKKSDEKKINKAIKNSVSVFKPLEKTKKVQIPEKNNDDKDVPAYVNSLPINAPINLSYEGVDYTFDITYDSNAKNWLHHEIKNGANHYAVIINPDICFFSAIREKERFDLIQNMALLITIAQFSSKKAGFKDSSKFTVKINEILNNLGKKDE